MSHRAFREVAHRPWPLPRSAWVLEMQWVDLAFFHWPVAPERLRGLLPPALELDTFDGSAWLGLVPFRMAGVRLRGLPPLPSATYFPELNLRTYARLAGKPGVWFFSLDAASRLAVRGARLAFRLPYFDARMSASKSAGEVHYASERSHRGAPPAGLEVRWSATAQHLRARPGSIEHWLTERYCMFTPGPAGTPRVAHIQHVPWELAPARAHFARSDMTRLLGFELDGPAPLQHSAADQHVVAWLPGWE